MPSKPATETYMSKNPSLFISIIVEPVYHLLSPETPDWIVMSSNFRFPWFKYNLLSVIFPVKNRSSKLSLLISPTETPPPI